MVYLEAIIGHVISHSIEGLTHVLRKEGGNLSPALVRHGIVSLACSPERVALDSRCKRLVVISVELINDSFLLFLLFVLVVIIVVVIVVVIIVVVIIVVVAAVASVTLQSAWKLLTLTINNILTHLSNIVFEVLGRLIKVSKHVLAAH